MLPDGTTGNAAGNQPCANPNGCPGGPTSLSRLVSVRRFDAG